MVAIGGCGGDPPATVGGKECADGAKQCPCYGNGTCDQGLVCRSDVCIADGEGAAAAGSGSGPPPEGGSAGSTATAGGNAAGAPGEPNAARGGSQGSNTGETGGDSGSGAGGEPDNATGGDPGRATGGSPGAATGGQPSTGTGGATSTGPNLIHNGDFADGGEYWELTWQEGDLAGYSDDGGEFCIANLSSLYYLSFSLGYPPTASDAFAIEAGATYTLSYRVWGYADIITKIGQAVSPYTAVASFSGSVASSTYVTKSHQLVATAGEPTAGLVFNGVLYYDEMVCFDDVVLTQD
jgi:hypothetical protein